MDSRRKLGRTNCVAGAAGSPSQCGSELTTPYSPTTILTEENFYTFLGESVLPRAGQYTSRLYDAALPRLVRAPGAASAAERAAGHPGLSLRRSIPANWQAT
jgi:hypothetical protein